MNEKKTTKGKESNANKKRKQREEEKKVMQRGEH
jgi:hypothetical protein